MKARSNHYNYIPFHIDKKLYIFKISRPLANDLHLSLTIVTTYYIHIHSQS